MGGILEDAGRTNHRVGLPMHRTLSLTDSDRRLVEMQVRSELKTCVESIVHELYGDRDSALQSATLMMMHELCDRRIRVGLVDEEALTLGSVSLPPGGPDRPAE